MIPISGTNTFNKLPARSLAAPNQRYDTASAAAAEAGAEYGFLRGSQVTSAAVIETQLRRWRQLEHWRRDVDAAIERLEDIVT